MKELILKLGRFFKKGIQKVHFWIYSLCADKSAAQQIQEQIAALPVSNGSRYYQKSEKRVGIVADIFVVQNYASTCALRYLTPTNWETELADLDCLLVVSVWHGLQNEWTGAAKPQHERNRLLHHLMKKAKERGIPVLFYSKEDPTNFAHFENLAAAADCIFTSAVESVEQYQVRFPKASTYQLSFAIAPQIQNPIGSCREKIEETVFFAGSWIKKYPNRLQEQRKIFEWIQKAGFQLRIVDRNYNRGNSNYYYPLRYAASVIPQVPYEQTAGLYKLYHWTLNINSVTDSQTMFAMRVYDALACGSLVLSNPSQGMQRIFPEVIVVEDFDKLKNGLLADLQTQHAQKLSGIRAAFRQGCVFERMAFMLSKAGLGEGHTTRTVAVICLATGEAAASIQAMFEQQSYPNKKLFQFPVEESMLLGCDMIAFWAQGRRYEPFYLEDMVNGFKYTNCDYITKNRFVDKGQLRQGKEHEYTTQIFDLYATLFWKSSFAFEQLICLPSRGIEMPNGYSSDSASYEVMGNG